MCLDSTKARELELEGADQVFEAIVDDTAGICKGICDSVEIFEIREEPFPHHDREVKVLWIGHHQISF